MLKPQNIPFNYTNKAITSNERKLYADYFREMIQRYGVATQYYQNQYVEPEGINVYGEDQITGFLPPRPIVLMMDLPNESILFSKFGLQTDADFNGIISIADWFNIFGKGKKDEPKAGDVVRIMNTGWSEAEVENSPGCEVDSFLDILNKNTYAICRNTADKCEGPTNLLLDSDAEDWRRYPQMYQITEARYQDIGAGINFLMGHYVFIIRGKRFDYSYEPGIHPETNPVQNTPIAPIKPDQEHVVDDNDKLEEDSGKLFDYDEFPKSNPWIYGNY